MPKLSAAQKSAQTTQRAASPDAQLGEHGIALAPPVYGIEVADRLPAQADGATIQRQAAPAATRDDAPCAPQPNRTGLPDALKSGIESLSGLALDDVRVRFNSSRPARLQALAYTQGNEIHIAPGQSRHLPHEAWHVVQQKQGRVRPSFQLAGVPINDDAGLEYEAHVMGARAVQLKGAVHDSRSSPIVAPQDHGLASVQRIAPVRMSAPIPTGGGSYKLVAGEDGRQVGSVTVHAKDGASIEVTDLGVAQAHRAQGIGKQLIASAARTGLQLGKAKVALAAQDMGSGRLTQWYKRMGFAQVGLHQSGYPQLEAPIGRVLGGVVQRWSSNGPLDLRPSDFRTARALCSGAVQRMEESLPRGPEQGSSLSLNKTTLLTHKEDMTIAKGLEFLGYLAAGNVRVLDELEIRGRIDKSKLEEIIRNRSYEFGLAKQSDKGAVIIVGEAGVVNWDVLDKTWEPVAHTHPLNPEINPTEKDNRELTKGLSLDSLFEKDNLESRSLVLPSMSDFWHKDHTVYTPYLVAKRWAYPANSKNLDDAQPLVFTIKFQNRTEYSRGYLITATLSVDNDWQKTVYAYEPDKEDEALEFGGLPPQDTKDINFNTLREQNVSLQKHFKRRKRQGSSPTKPSLKAEDLDDLQEIDFAALMDQSFGGKNY